MSESCKEHPDAEHIILCADCHEDEGQQLREAQSELTALRTTVNEWHDDFTKPPKERSYCANCELPGENPRLRTALYFARRAMGYALMDAIPWEGRRQALEDAIAVVNEALGKEST